MMARSAPERLALEILLDAEAENPNARALNTSACAAAAKSMIMIRDELTDEMVRCKTKVVSTLPVHGRFCKSQLGYRAVILADEGPIWSFAMLRLRKTLARTSSSSRTKMAVVVLIPLYDSADRHVGYPGDHPARCVAQEERCILHGPGEACFPSGS